MWTRAVLCCFLTLHFWGISHATLAGQQFATTFMQNYIAYYDNLVFQLQITAVYSSCSVKVTVPSLGFVQVKHLSAGQGTSINLPSGVELLGSQRSSTTIQIQATDDICVSSLNSKVYTADASVVYPMSEWGVSYIVFTPSVTPLTMKKQFAFINGPDRNNVTIFLKAAVQFEGTQYAAGSSLSISLEAFVNVQLQSDDDMTGTRIVALLPVAVYVGHTCTWQFGKCNHVYEQLLPVPSWGTYFLVPPLAIQNQYDSVFVQASQLTNVSVRSNSLTVNNTIDAGQVVEYRLQFPEALSITADHGVQVLLLFNGVQLSWSVIYDSFLVNLVPNNRIGFSYVLNGQEGFDNRALIVVATKDTAGVQFDGAPLPSTVQWRAVERSGFSWTELVYQSGVGRHIVSHSNAPLGLYSIGFAVMNGYGASAVCTKPVPVNCSVANCRKDEQCVLLSSIPTCVMRQCGICTMGDPHYHTFDGQSFDFMGSCSYVLTKSSNGTLPAFEVQVQNENRGDICISFVALVTVKVGGITIMIDRTRRGQVRAERGVWSLPVQMNDGGVNVSQSGMYVTVQTSIGLSVQYDWDSHLLVKLPDTFMSKVCGLCGNFNGNPNDDLTTPSGTGASSAAELAHSWKVSNLTAGVRCVDTYGGSCRSCDDAVLKKWKITSPCGILNATNGPFSRCNSVIDPKVYLQDCLFDTCMANGFWYYLCKALEVYAGVCQRAGVQLTDWRSVSNCTYVCPDNSYYELCGSACPATCLDPYAPKNCTLPCVETCTCNPGFVLSGTACVPSNGCGCLRNGSYVPAGQSFWADDGCRTLCQCPANGGQLDCKNGTCKAGQKCEVVNGIRNCYPVSQNSCLVFGDPHYYTFDGTWFNFQDACVYQLVGLCTSDPGLVPFNVLVRNDFRGSGEVSFTKLLQVNVYNLSIVISKEYKGSVMVGDVLLNLPLLLNNGHISVFRSGWSAVVQTSFGLSVSFDWDSTASVSLPSTYMGAVCGLCGNYNGRPQDDLSLNRTNSSSSPATFGASCQVAGGPDCVSSCADGCIACNSSQQTYYESGEFCGVLVDPSGPFRECHAVLDPEGFFEGCVYDVCKYHGRRDVPCQAVGAYMSACQDLGVAVYSWRTAQFCGVQCPPHSHYEVCGPGCPTTCHSLVSPFSCEHKCKEACVCDQDFILSGDKCVPLAQCGCLYGVHYYQQGQVFFPDSLCQKECTCMPTGQVVCKNFTCGPYEKCELTSGIRRCRPVDYAVCEALGDPHYVSFDGFHFDLQGTCTYTLSQTCGMEGNNLVPFAVVVKNEKWWPNMAFNVSVTKEVSLMVYGYTFVLRQNTAQILQVNGVLTDLPWSLNDGKVQISKEGKDYVMKTEFGVRVTFDLAYYATVTVPGTYRGKTCGLCGNFDKNASNDFRLPDGNVTKDVNTFGKAWMVPSPGAAYVGGCYGNQCPAPPPALAAVFAGPAYCGLLSDPAGPFVACHAVLDPAVYLTHCVFDVWASGGSSAVACEGVAAYALRCHMAGVAIKSWRTNAFCPMSCPKNSHYELCADTYSVACPGLSDIAQNPRFCNEGCTCDLGYLFNGEHCIPYKECGCYKGGITYKPGEVMYQAQCQQMCVCNPGTGVTCASNSCPNGTQCLLREGVLGCFHSDPCKDIQCREQEVCRVEGVHATCAPLFTATCWSWGDLHYQTFDGFCYDFQGTCRYTLTTTCGNVDGLVPFSVTESSSNLGNVSLVRDINVDVYDTSITIEKFQWGQIMVHGERLYLPLVLLDGRIRARQLGAAAVVETDFGLRVSYDWYSLMSVQLPSGYHGSVCGLCGNFDGDRGDELRGPAGESRASVLSWVSSWKAGVPGCNDSYGGNSSAYGGNSSAYTAAQQAAYGSEASCGALTSASPGVFRACWPKVDPAAFQQACVNDLCASNGDHRLLCMALEAYSSRCYQEGVVVSSWREQFNCPMRCQPNSHYDPCASPCPETCTTLGQNVTCAGTCVEACVCDSGYFLSGDTCIASSQCGCRYEGRYYTQGQRFWADAGCRRLCECDSALGAVLCSEAPPSETCVLVDGLRTSLAPAKATCVVYGDPHYRTFDGLPFDFQGSGIYQLVALCSQGSGLVPFNVTVQNEIQASLAVGFTRALMVLVYGVNITMTKQYPYQILLNGMLTDLPLELQNAVVYRTGNAIILEATFGLQVTFDQAGGLQVTLPSTYGRAVCGLCGNYDGSSQNDFATPYGEAPDVFTLGQSWQISPAPQVGASPGFAVFLQGARDFALCPTCADAQKNEAQLQCSIIADSAGPFRGCQGTIDPGPYVADCVFDVCLYQGFHSILCDAIAAYVTACQSRGVTVQPWRNDTFCSVSCPPNSHYSLCAPGCADTCAGLYSAPHCSKPCSEGCGCDAGFVLSGVACVPLARCGCLYGGRYYEKGAAFYGDARCRLRCMCGENGAVACNASTCSQGETCTVVGGVVGCRPAGYRSCVASGDLRYTSFDGRTFGLKGASAYMLARVCATPSKMLTSFSVETENGKGETSGTTGIQAVTVSVYNFTISIRQDTRWRVTVNKENINLPATLDARISLTQLGLTLSLQTDFGLQVLYGAEQLEVRALTTYNGSTCGLCGNSNGNPSDDFLLPGGNNATSVAAFGQAWASAPPGEPHQGYEGPGPDEPGNVAQYGGNDLCGIISSPTGPFHGCQTQVNPQTYASGCVSDMAVTGGSVASLCQSIQAYATACQLAGQNIEAWRNSTFCPIQCPANSYYSVCSDTCVNTCASLTWPASTCTIGCLEGCRCVDGFLWDSDQCVAPKDCGCVHDGKYLKVGEVSVSATCEMACMCLSGGVLRCDRYTCGSGQVCDVQDGRRGCQVVQSLCVVGPAPTFRPFDGSLRAVRQGGAFVMAFVCDEQLPEWFRVVMELQSRGTNTSTSVTMLHVFTQSSAITVNYQNQCWVNGKKVTYPSRPVPDVLIGRMGGGVVIERASVVRVEYTPFQQLTLAISQNLAGKMCGPCGNYSGNPPDNTVPSNGTAPPVLLLDLVSWQAGDFTGCADY
ncbi:IgGFc-binding protein [Brachyhypopomus gauderio]|uniref:IgGFc-binding protein n=1 Tax=Brachyhypopomus gauderio TaxID=698409 RepID=UPI004041B43F